MTIKDLCKQQPTESQYEILQRADRLFAGPPYQGRYYGGKLTFVQVQILTDRVELRKETKEMITQYEIATSKS